MRIQIGNIGFDPLTRACVVARIKTDASAEKGGVVVTPNLDFSWIASHVKGTKELFAKADISVVDGVPMMWLAKLKNQPLPERVAGADLFWDVAGVLDETIPFVIIGGQLGAANRAAEAVKRKFPQLVTATHYPVYGFENSQEAMGELRAVIPKDSSAVVVLALGAPKQEYLAMQLHDEFPKCWFLCIGAAVDFAAGMVSRAPVWMQKRGIEWVYRLYQEPGRLFQRYIIQDLPHFAILFVRTFVQRFKTSKL